MDSWTHDAAIRNTISQLATLPPDHCENSGKQVIVGHTTTIRQRNDILQRTDASETRMDVILGNYAAKDWRLKNTRLQP